MEGPRAYTFPPPPGEDPRIPTPQRSISLQSMGHSGGSPRSGSGPRRHKCPYCSTDFTRHHNLKSHLLTHSQEKPYECETCNSRFRRLHDLKRHQKLHTGERPHTCQKCGRKFARGDALARHNKGQGGCAGRRSSFGVDSTGDGAMDGVEYTAEPEHMDEDEMDGARRISEPAGRQHSLQSNSRQASTYPPLGARYPGGGVAPMYPPTSAPSHQSSGPTTGSGSSMPFPNAHNNVFAQSGMAESPKPISPGQPGQRHPGLPPPHGPGSNQLPSLSGIRGGPGSHPGSMSSHSGSGASIREFLGGARNETDVLNYARDLEVRLETQQRDHEARMAQMQEEHQKQLNQLRDEIRSLKAATDAKPA
jgi:Zinc finger, C2H2 type